MNWNLFWGLYVMAFAFACLIVAYALGWRSRAKGKRCSVRTRGTIVRYSSVRYNGFSLPVVKYMVDGNEYTVVGPHFKAGVIKNFSAPWNNPMTEQESNIQGSEPLPDVLKVSRKSNSFVSMTHSPLMERYPVGGTVDVYYDPRKPKRAYVERYAGTMQFFSFWLPMVFGILLLCLSIYLFVGPEIIMK